MKVDRMNSYKKIKEVALLCIVGASILLSSCIKEDFDDCNYQLRLLYDYNMDYVDLFSKQASRVNLFVFDDEGVFIKEIEKPVSNQLSAFYMDVDVPFNRSYNFLAWSGLYDEYYTLNQKMKAGVTHIDDVELSLTELNNEILSKELPPLWFGRIQDKVGSLGSGVMPLTKNTNKIRIAMRILPTVETDLKLVKEKFNFYIQSSNTSYNSTNQVLSEKPFKYAPYYAENDEKGFIVELNTLRLMANRENLLVITDPETDEVRFTMDLNEYLDDLRFLSNNKLSLQEFMDREDEYAMIFFFGGKDDMFSSLSVEINGWLVRKQDVNE
nr:FimB/Mfa2 family fimbrial subunit [Bacteroides coprosuis]